MERIRENMFFVVTGVIVLLCIAFYFNPFFSVYSLERQNRDLDEQVKKLEGQLRTWSKDPFVPNDSAVEAAKDYHGKYVTMFDGGKDAKGEPIEGVKDYFARMVLSTGLPGLPPEDLNSPQRFLTVYRGAVKTLIQEARDSGIKCDANAWTFWDWAEQVPDAKEQRDEAAREYWLTSEILDVLQQKALNVVTLDKIDINPGIEKNAKFNAGAFVLQRRGDYFDAMPFTIQLKMQFQQFPELIGKLLTTRTPINVDRVSISRLTEEQRKAKDFPRGVIVNVKLDCLALNYRVSPPVGSGTGTTGTPAAGTLFGGTGGRSK